MEHDSNEKFLEKNDISRNDDGKVIAESYTLKDLLKRFPASKIDVSYVTHLDEIFKDYNKDNTEFFDIDDLSSWNISNVISMKNVFQNAVIDKDLGINNWNTNKVEDMSNAFDKTISNDKLDLSNWKLSNLKVHDNAFLNCDIKNEFLPNRDYFDNKKENNELNVSNKEQNNTEINNPGDLIYKTIDQHCNELTNEDKEQGLFSIAMLQTAFKHLKELLKDANIPSHLKSSFNNIAQHLGNMNDPTLSLISGVIHGFTKDSNDKTYIKDKIGTNLVNKEINGETLDKLLKSDILNDRNITNLETFIKKIGVKGLLNNKKMFKQYMEEKFIQDKPKPEEMEKYNNYIKQYIEDLRNLATNGKGVVSTFEEYLKNYQKNSIDKDIEVNNNSKKSKEDLER